MATSTNAINEHDIVHPLGSRDNVKKGIVPEDYYEPKEVDRKLSYFLVTPSSIICDVGAAWGIDAFPLAMRASLCISLGINRNAVRSGARAKNFSQTQTLTNTN